MSAPVQVLAIGAHPDDIEFGCAPLLLLERRQGHAVHLLVLSHGEAGSAGTPAARDAEAQAAAARIGGTLEWLEFGGDCHLEATPARAIVLAAIIRRLRPAVVLAPNPRPDQHPDHAAAGQLARNACRLARYGGLRDLLPAPAHAIAHLYFYEITQPLRHVPRLVVDISPVVEEWEAVMRLHASQTGARPYIELQKSAARHLGLSAGCAYALGVESDEPVRVARLSDLALSARAF